jgi:hypothetical protein
MTTPTTERGTAWLLARVLVVPLVVLVVAATLLVTTQALAVRDAGEAMTETARPVTEQPWKAAYSRRFRGCVPAVLWPNRETPVAVIVKWHGDQVQRIDRGAALRRALGDRRADDGRIIGACYR